MQSWAGFALCISVALATGSSAQSGITLNPVEAKRVIQHATGSFEVKIAPVEVSGIGKAGGLGRMTIDKAFSGDLVGTSKGEMLTGITQNTGAMAYVAIETVTATINGHGGTFVLSHNATMMKGDAASGVMNVVVVPNSATGGLAGLSGSMVITIVGSQHTYDFAYTLPAR